jgi:hypothetical protein
VCEWVSAMLPTPVPVAVLVLLPCRQGLTLQVADADQDNPYREQYFNFYDERIMELKWAEQPNQEIMIEFFRMLALCHTVIPDGRPRGAALTGPRGLPVRASCTCQPPLYSFACQQGADLPAARASFNAGACASLCYTGVTLQPHCPHCLTTTPHSPRLRHTLADHLAILPPPPHPHTHAHTYRPGRPAGNPLRGRIPG